MSLWVLLEARHFTNVRHSPVRGLLPAYLERLDSGLTNELGQNVVGRSDAIRLGLGYTFYDVDEKTDMGNFLKVLVPQHPTQPCRCRWTLSRRERAPGRFPKRMSPRDVHPAIHKFILTNSDLAYNHGT
jgi:hypothetical protein